jgi:hypothetical protein
MNNNNGVIDEHHGFNWEHGVLNYHDILPKIRAIDSNLDFVLEMDEVDAMCDSLSYFRL